MPGQGPVVPPGRAEFSTGDNIPAVDGGKYLGVADPDYPV
jgi:hypothetical protein